MVKMKWCILCQSVGSPMLVNSLLLYLAVTLHQKLDYDATAQHLRCTLMLCYFDAKRISQSVLIIVCV